MTRLDALRNDVEGCHACELYQDATQAVFSRGRASAPIMLVGEQPGDREDIEGEPFVGPAGRVLDEALEAANIPSGDVYLTNAVKHFRFERRGARRIHKKPAISHLTACHPWLKAELDLVRPKVVVCLGATAGRSVLGRPVRIAAERGRVIGDALEGSAVVVTTHPSALLRLRDHSAYDGELARLAADLRVAADAA
ncbi:MAG: uracil-DNA glycosylase [Nocardioidaceae bacterium]|nr:uracil-DNA glycosylase [Nocardioidaceae bacterium]